MKKAKIATIAMILMLGLGACGNNKAGSAESAVSTENAQTVSETGSESSGKLMAGDETYQYVLDRNSGKLTMAGKEAGKTEVPDDFVSTEQSEGNIESSDIIKDVTINEGVFTGETTLNVYFGGTEADWNKITIGNDNKALETANIHYESDGE